MARPSFLLFPQGVLFKTSMKGMERECFYESKAQPHPKEGSVGLREPRLSVL